MIINSIELTGFMRFKDKTSVDFKDGIGVIYGNNGSGKTSIFDAVCMALYGKSYRTSGSSDNGFLNVGNLVNKTSKTSKIVLSFSSQNKDYVIEKNISKSGKTTAYLFESGQQIAEGRNVHSMIVDKLVGMDYVSFKNSLFIAQNEAMSLLDSTGSERKNILRSLLKLDVYDILLNTSNKVKKEYENKISKLEGELSVLKSNIDYEPQIKEEIERSKSEIREMKEKKKSFPTSALDEEIAKLNDELIAVRKDRESLNAKLESLKFSNNRLNREIADLNDRLEKVNGVSVCPYCFSKITNPEHLHQHYESETNSRKKEMDDNSKEIEKILKDIATHDSKIKSLNDSIMADVDRKNKEERDFSNAIIELETKIKDDEREISKINTYKRESKNKEKEIAEMNDKLFAIDLLKEAYREVPNVIIRRIAPFIEKESSEIVDFISDGVIEDISIDRDTFKIKPVVAGVPEEIQFLSGGEKLRVGIALRLAISKMMVMTSSSGTIVKNLFVDEGDFGALDESGLNDIASLFVKLKEKFNKIILITHIEDLKNKVADYAYNIVKTGNYLSSVVETSSSNA